MAPAAAQANDSSAEEKILRAATEATPLVLGAVPEAGKAAPAGRNTTTLFKEVTVSLSLACGYIAASSGMILLNKHLMRPDAFPYPAALTAMHMFSALVVGSALCRVKPDLFPSMRTVFGEASDKDSRALDFNPSPFHEVAYMGRKLAPFIPVAACGTISLVGGNAAYRYASVSFLQMVKESHVVFVYTLMVVFGMEKLNFRRCTVLGFVVCTAALAVYGELRFSWTGLTLQLVAGAAQSTQIVLSNVLMSRAGGLKIDPLTMVLCQSPAMLSFLIPANFVMWDPLIPLRFVECAPLLIVSCGGAICLQVVTTCLVKNVSATGHALASVVKDLFIVAAAAYFLHESLSRLQIVGFLGSVLGITMYSVMKLFPEYFEPVAALKDEQRV